MADTQLRAYMRLAERAQRGDLRPLSHAALSLLHAALRHNRAHWLRTVTP